MNNEEMFTNEDVLTFCSLTGDERSRKKARYLMEEGKHPIVPGFLNFSVAAAKFGSEYLRDHTKLIQIYFGSFLSVGERVRYNALVGDLELLLHAVKHEKDGVVNTLAKQKNHTRLTSASDISHETFEGKLIAFECIPEYIKGFAELLKAKVQQDITDFLYTLSHSSLAIIHHIDEKSVRDELGITEAVNKIKEKMKRKGIESEMDYAAIYKSIEIVLPNGFFTIDYQYPLYFFVKGGKAKGSYIDFKVRCEQNGRNLFTGAYNLLGMAENKVVERTNDISKNLLLK